MTGDRLAGTRRQVRGIALGAVSVLLLATAWAVTEPRVLQEDAGLMVTSSVPLGGSMYVGQSHLGERDVVLERVEAVTLGGLEATVWLCRPVPGAEAIGTSSSGDIDDHCDLAPVTPGTLLPEAAPTADGRTPEHLVVELQPTVTAPQGFCGLDVTYRDGWRTVRQRQAATHQAVTNPSDETDGLADPFRVLDDCPQQRAE